MKRYFAKSVTVEGKIRSRDRFIHSLTNQIHINNDITSIVHPDYKKVKLFLCSRDIQVGDEVYTNYDGKRGTVKSMGMLVYYNEHDYPDEKKNVYKVIGEISPEATWIKEGDEFDGEEVKFVYRAYSAINSEPDNYECSEIEWINTEIEPYCVTDKWIEIKGPCGHFH